MKGTTISPHPNVEEPAPGPHLHSLHLATLFGFAVAQPLFDLIGRYPEFLVAHGIGTVGLVFFALGLALALPLFGWVTLVLLNQLSRKLEIASAVLLIGLLSGLLALQVFARTIPAPGPLLVTEAVGTGLGLGWAYYRFSGLQYFLTTLSPSLAIFPALFLIGSPLWSRGSEPFGMPEVDSSTPIVMVVFDEFPAVSLLGPDGRIDPVRYPNLATLSQEAHWFKNTSTVSEGTLISIPAILNGLYPKPGSDRLPIWSDHSRSLFALLRHSHHLNIKENITQLAPPDVAAPKLDPAMLVSDLKLVYLHQLLPTDLAHELPPIMGSWKDFAVGSENGPTQWAEFKANWSLRGKQFHDFVQSIQPTIRPGLHFLHSTLPHASWKYLPDGRLYTLFEKPGVAGVVGPNHEGLDVNQWLEDEWPPIQAYKRHLLQVGYVDTLVGALMDHLKEQGLYEKTLLVLTSDHGASFLAGDSRRRITPSNYPGLISVPLIIKEPWQEEGQTYNRNVETIDILPTILDILNIDIPWQLDGTSALSLLPERPFKVVYSDQGDQFTFDSRLSAREEFVEQKIDLFGSGDWKNLFEAGPYRELVGKKLTNLRIKKARSNDPVVALEGSNFFRNADLESSFLLCLVRGRLELSGENWKPLELAIAVNGVIRSTTRTSPVLEGSLAFTSLVDPASFVDGVNRVEVLLIQGSRNHPNLRRVKRRDPPLFVETKGEGEERLVYKSGNSLPVRQDVIKGWVVGGKSEIPNRFFVGGWVVDQKKSSLVSSVLALVDEEVVATGATQFERPEAVSMFENSALLDSGFRLEFQLPSGSAPGASEVRVMAVSGGVAGELNYPEDRGLWPFLPERAGTNIVPVYTWGEILTFGVKGSSAPYLQEGWGRPVEEMNWTLGERATLHFQVKGTRGPVVLEAFLKPFLAKGRLDAQRIYIHANGVLIGDWLASEDTFQTYRLEIAAGRIPKRGMVTLEFQTPDAAVPVTLGVGPDPRVLGLAMIWIRLSFAF